MARRKRNPFTLAEHNALGVELQAMRDRLFDLCGVMYTRYPKKIYLRGAGKALAGVDALRASLDNRLFEEYWRGPDDDSLKHTYYRKTHPGDCDAWLMDILPKPVTSANLCDRPPR